MSTSEEYYKKKLYPFQDGILDIVRKSGTPFYLTGGTALSRRWFHHRYSEDLDLFVDDDPGFAAFVDRLFISLKEGERRGGFKLDEGRVRRSDSYAQLWLTDSRGEKLDLKVDLINDVASRVGEVEVDPVLGRVDNWRNILANKIAAISRYEPKDGADLWVIARNRPFEWREAVQNALRKEAGLDPVALHEIIRSIPEQELARVLWSFDVNLVAVRADLAAIAEDILYGKSNSLCPA